jgi:hypothetical protein
MIPKDCKRLAEVGRSPPARTPEEGVVRLLQHAAARVKERARLKTSRTPLPEPPASRPASPRDPATSSPPSP